MKTCVTLFSGGGGSEMGAIAAGYTPALSVEHDEKIAAVFRANFSHELIVGDVQAVNVCNLKKRVGAVDLLMASPPCQNASVARSKNLPRREDADVGLDILRWTSVLAPRLVVIENVPPYRHSQSFRAVVQGLTTQGYMVGYEIVNSADYGVPQTRRRLILRAVKDSLLPPMPQAVKLWKGWYQAIEDLLPSCPPSQFAPWQFARLGKCVFEDCLIENQATIRDATIRRRSEPAMIVNAGSLRRPACGPTAFLIEGCASGDRPPTVLSPDAPCFTVTTPSGGRSHRAFLVGDQKSGVDGILTADGSYPAFTTDTRPANKTRAWLEQGRVVRLTPRCLARFMGFPDSYILPENKTLASKVIGNAVCPPVMEAVLGGINV